MNETSPGILILGGGVTGMSAALALNNLDIPVHLVEKRDRLGGNAADWACMATDTCQHCGACLAQEMADQIRQSESICVHLSTELTGLNQTAKGLEATLSSGTALTAAKAVMATGFSPFDPAALPAYHTDEYEKVITTAQLNTLLKEDRLAQIAGSSPRIAFLQCVGSRDREQNRDYCSQVCCKISMRHAKKITHLMPDAQICLYYMDLQVIGKETRTLAQSLEGDVRLIQGVPAEILEDRETGRLTMVTEDPETLSRRSQAFDLIVLSVGMVPAQDARDLSAALGITPNSWGFYNTLDADPGNEILVAGCAKGPQNIPSAIQEGRTVAARILRELQPPADTPSIAVIGSGPQAATLCAAAAEKGYPACLFGSAAGLAPGVQALETAKILAVDGTTGNFSIFYEMGETRQTLDCGAIIAAPPAGLSNRVERLDNALSLSEFAGLAPKDRPDNSLILLDYFDPESKILAREALVLAIETRKAGKDVDILMNKMLVHGPEGQRLYDRARTLGIRFLRYDSPEDIVIGSGEKGLEISVKESTLPGMTLTLSPDKLVVPEIPVPGGEFGELAGLLRTGLDLEGFLQPANIRHRPVNSQRKGIYFAGSGHDDIDSDDLKWEAEAILADLALRSETSREPGRLTINNNICASCLTCYRVCPHGAVIINERQEPQIMAEACFECHACLSNCPACAISSPGQANADLAAGAKPGTTLVLACERSAALAAPDPLPENTALVAVPCACRVSPEIILRALVQGADRVVVSGCHDGNCRSMDGTAMARRSAALASAFPGVPKEKVAFKSVAANEPCAFTRALTQDR